MKYIVIQRRLTSASWMIRFLENGDTEILEVAENYHWEDVKDKETVDRHGETYFWDEWADAELWQRVWIDDEQENGSDVTKTEFDDFDKAFDYLGKKNNE